MAQPDLFDLYFAYRKDTEPPAIFHRWAITTCFGAWLGRQVWIPFGSSRIFPTQYVMFVGDPGSRKTTAINMAVNILRSAGYAQFSAQRTSKEKFLLDLAGDEEEGKKTYASPMAALDDISLLDVNTGEPREVFINADEFNNFMGPGNLEFQSILGELWDWDNPDVGYKYRLKNSKDLEIWQPTVSILAGNTPSNFALCFPPASVGQGFMSRLILVHGEGTGRKITFPEEPPASMKENLLRQFLAAKAKLHGKMEIDPEARHILDMMYKTWPELEDTRFKHYSTRRFTHLLRLCIIYACARLSQTIEPLDVVRANTVLAYAETLMPKALGELGKSKNSEAANKIMQALFATKKPLDTQQLWAIVRSDLDKPADLSQVLSNLQYAGQIQLTPIPGGKSGMMGYLPQTKTISRQVNYIDYNYLKGKEFP
jgi:hypothetical protein